MKHKIIQTNNYLLVVDDSEIKIGDIVLEKYVDGTIGLEQINTLNDIHSLLHKKIIAHLPLNGASILNGVDLLPPLEDEAEVMAEEYSKNYYDDNAQDDVYYGFFQGYNKAKERFKYTEEDMREAFKAGQLDKGNNWYGGDFIEFIQSHQTKMPIGFNLETKDTHIQNGVLVKTQWVGEYIFE
jgi:hypothetical protein